MPELKPFTSTYTISWQYQETGITVGLLDRLIINSIINMRTQTFEDPLFE